MSGLEAWLERISSVHSQGIDLGLERVAAVARRLGLLDAPPPCITVAGTNGKGSTVAYLAAIAAAAGRHYGVFSSPHLLRFNERIRVDSRQADDATIVAALESVDAARGGISLTYFEFNTLAALCIFRDQQVDLMILEVGLGGRLDATNIVAADVAVIVSIGFDHMAWLGNTLDDIAREKAGIARRGRPVVLGPEPLPTTLHGQLRELGSKVVQVGEDVSFACADGGWCYRGTRTVRRGLAAPPLMGHAQAGNLAAAMAAWEQLGRWPLPDAKRLNSALSALSLPGRMQRHVDSCEWLLDVAHNVPAAEELARNLAQLQRPRTCWAIAGFLSDKDPHGCASALRAQVDRWVLCDIDDPRGLTADDVAARLGDGFQVVLRCTSVAEACQRVRDEAEPGDRIVVFGSFHVVGPALAWLGIY